MIVYRLVRKDRTTLDGKGAALYPGRWNTQNILCLYTSASPSLAQLEVMVNSDDWKIFVAVPHVILHIEIPDKKITDLPVHDLPTGWDAPIAAKTTQEFGTSLLNDSKLLAFRVPSAINRLEHNIIINPRSIEFAHVKLVKKSAFKFDDRLLK